MAAFKFPIQLTINYVEWLWVNGGLTALLDDEIYSVSETALHQCNLCGAKFLAIPVVLKRRYKQGDNGCRSCNPREGGNYAWTNEKYRTELLKRRGDLFTLLGTYVNQNVQTLHRCNTCSHEWCPLPGLLLAGYGCPVCGHRKSAASAVRLKTLRIQGKEFSKLQGYEPQAITWIVANKKIRASEIVTAQTGAPCIEYTDENGSARKHFPDLYIEKRNLLVEVKSPYTFKLALGRNQTKCRAARASGYRYVMLVLDRQGAPLTLPANWQNKDKQKLLAEIPWLKN